MMNEFSWGEMDDEEFDSQFFSTLTDFKEDPPSTSSTSATSEYASRLHNDDSDSSSDLGVFQLIPNGGNMSLDSFGLNGPNPMYFPNNHYHRFHMHPNAVDPYCIGIGRRNNAVPPPIVLPNVMSPDTAKQVEEELQSLVISQTDPIGKYMKKIRLTPHDAIRYNVHELLLQAPRKQREKYGPRREIDVDERILTNRERNREHAKATRTRKRIFKEVEEVLQRGGYYNVYKYTK